MIDKELLTNKEAAVAFGGYDFRTPDMKAVCKAQIAKLLKLGYRKVRDGEPPLLSDEEIEDIYAAEESVNTSITDFMKASAQAQHDLCVRFYNG